MISLSLLFFGIIVSYPELSLQLSTSTDSSYVGAVVEYHPITDGDDGVIIAEANVNNYRYIIKMASTYSVDIIVFPEFGLTSIPMGKPLNVTDYRSYYSHTASPVPSPKDNVTLCDEQNTTYSESLKRISCAAREYNMYVVVNHHERLDCPTRDCSPDGYLLYSTNAAFDRNGRLVSRYRKHNLINVNGLNTTLEPDDSLFLTDFGVTFGQLIDYDLTKEKPWMTLINGNGIADIVVSSSLMSERPFLGTVQQQAAWAYAADVNLLAAGLNSDVVDSGGSGIYAGRRGPLRVHYPGSPSNALVVAVIKKKPNNRIERDERTYVHVFKQAEVPTLSTNTNNNQRINDKHEDLSLYSSQRLNTMENRQVATLCDRGVCCEFHVEIAFDRDLAERDGVVYYRYRLVAFGGVRGIADQSLGTEICALVSCTGDEIATCGQRYRKNKKIVEPTSFLALMITRRADLTGDRSFHAPTTAIRNNLPINSTDYGYVIGGPLNNSLLLAYLSRPRNDLAAFGIYGRIYDKDGETPTSPDKSGARGTIGGTIFVGFFIFAGFAL